MNTDLEALGPAADLRPDLEQLVCHNVPRVAPQTRVADAERLLERTRFDCVDDIVVHDATEFIGLVPLETLLAATPDQTVRDLVDLDPPSVAPGDDLEPATWKAVQHGGSSVAVVDGQGRCVGLIPARRLLAVLLAEHDEDLARVGGYLASTSSARSASEEPVARRFLHRLPWLLVGLAGALVAAGIVGRFEDQLSTNLTVAFFVPGIVYLADAVGTQTEALVIRGLSVGVSIRRVVARELLTGLLVGLVLAAAFLPVGLVLWDDADVVIAAAIALFAACSTATVVAMALPWLFDRAGRDPAFGSGPIATVIQDLASLVIYFAVVNAVVG